MGTYRTPTFRLKYSSYLPIMYRIAKKFNIDVNTIEYYLSLSPQKTAAIRKAAVRLALQAEWKNFFTFYREAYAIALKKAAARQ